MKKIIFISLLFTAVTLNGQTIVNLILPDNCNKPTNVEEPPVVDQTVLKIYPNPNDGSFYLHAEFSSPIKKAMITVSDLKGTVLYSEAVYCNSEALIRRIDIKEIKSGTYVLELFSDKQRISGKFLITK